MLKEQALSVYAEATPNPASMKFVLNTMLIEGKSVEYSCKEDAADSPIASQLFDFPFIKGVFIAANFITLTKSSQDDWYELIPGIRDFIRNFITSGGALFVEVPKQVIAGSATPNTELEEKIIGLLEEYIRPAVEQDGGAIAFKSFHNGIVTVTLKGACSGCPSSTLTLKAGIENLLKRMVPEVSEVVSQAM